MNVSTAAHSYTRLNVLSQILASQIASVVESGNLGQLLWCDPLKQDTDDLISEKFSMHRIHVMVLEYGCTYIHRVYALRSSRMTSFAIVHLDHVSPLF